MNFKLFLKKLHFWKIAAAAFDDPLMGSLPPPLDLLEEKREIKRFFLVLFPFSFVGQITNLMKINNMQINK